MTERTYHPGENYEYPLIIKKILNPALIYSPEREIVYDDKLRYDYRTLNARIHRLAGGLHSLGVRRKDVIAVFDYDSHRYLECFFAVPMLGAVLQTVNWRLSADQVLYTLNHAEARMIIIHEDFLPILSRLAGKLETVQKIIVIIESGNLELLEAGVNVAAEYEQLLNASSEAYEFPDFDEDTRATTFYTTGTTGNPKGVHFSHRQLTLHTLAVAVAMGSYHTQGRFRSNDVYMPLTPMFHVHAWGFPYVATLLGAKQVYPGPYEPERLLKLIQREAVTWSHCVPTILQMLLNSPDIDQVDLSNWKLTIGGARLPKGLAKAARDRGIEINAGYGMSETCPVMTTATPMEHMLDWEEDKLLDIIIKTGRPLPLVEIEVFDSGDRALPHDGESTGEVVMRAPWLTKSYRKAKDKTQQLWRSGWLHSGDVGYIDPNGYLQITDRIKDVIKTGGEWVSSLDLENLLSQHKAVQESAAIGVTDEKWGERPLMVVTLQPEFRGKVASADLKKFMLQFALEGKLPKYGVPEHYEFVDEIPKTSVGKLDKKELRRVYAN